MPFRKLVGLFFIGFILSQCSANRNSGKAWQKSILESYYNVWSTGMAPAGTGANFFVKFNRTANISINSFSVNGEELEFEIEQTETETLIIGRKYTGPDFENQNQEMPEFYKQEKYSGTIIFKSDEQLVTVSISTFEHRAPEQQNL